MYENGKRNTHAEINFRKNIFFHKEAALRIKIKECLEKVMNKELKASKKAIIHRTKD